MELLYQETNGLVQQVQELFKQLEQLKGRETDAIQTEIQTKISTIISNCEKLDILVHKEPLARRQHAKLRVDQLKYDNRHLQAALHIYQNEVLKRKREEQEREELLTRRFTTNALADQTTAILIDHSLQHNTSLQNAHRGMDDMLISGSHILESMRNQRYTLKGAQRRIIDIANTLGLSNTTMRLIERRAAEDKYVLFGGMFVTLVVIVLLIVYLT